MRYLKPKQLSALCGVAGLAASTSTAAITAASDDFSTNTGTFPNWASVGAVNTAIGYDGTSVGDYDDGDPTLKLSYASGMVLTGDGVKDDGGLRLNTQNAIPGDEAIGLTLGGTMEAGKQIVFSGSVYNDNSSYSKYNAQLWNLTDGLLLAQSGSTLVQGSGAADYVPVDFNVSYVAAATDAGDTLQIRFVEDNDNTARDIYLDNFALVSQPAPVFAHPRLFFSSGDLAELRARRLTTHSDEWAQVIAQCDALQGTLPTTTPRTASGLLGYEDKIVALALAQLIDPSLPYQTTSDNWFWTILNWTEWGEGYWSWPDYGPRGNLETGEILRALAIWYDLQYQNLSPAQRDEVSQKLADYADRYRNSYSRFWTTDNGELTGNHCWNAFASLASVYYAADDIPAARSNDWSNLLDGHYNTISNLMTTVMADGVSGEGGTYWLYGIEKILLWYQMRNVAGEPAFEGIDWFANTAAYGIYSILPGGADNFGGITRFDDANPDYWGNPYNELSLLAKATRDPVAQWMANELDHSGVNSKNAYRYMFYDPTVPTIDPEADLNNWRYFDNYGFFLWRTAWSNDAQHFALRSGQHSHGHSKCDDGQFMIARAGVPYIANLGYAVPRYTQDANVLLVDGTGQYSDGDDWGTVFNATWPNNTNTWGKTLHVLANDTYYQKGDFFNVLIDPTQMYTNPDLSQWRREVVGLGGNLYLLRDTVSAGTSVSFDLLLHAQVTATSSGNTYDQDTYAASNPWNSLGSGKWEINARSGSPRMLVQDLSSDVWNPVIEETWYESKYTGHTRRGNRLRRSLSGTAGTSLVSFGFDDLMAGWTQTAWVDSAAEGIHIATILDVLWPLNGISVSASDGWNVTGKMAGRRFGDSFFGRETTLMQNNGLDLLSATTPVSFHAKTEQEPGGAVPLRIVLQAAAPSTLTIYAPHEPKSVLLDGSSIAFAWTNNQLSVSVPATEGTILDLVDEAYLSWRDTHFSEAEIASGLAGLDEDPDGDNLSNWNEFVADTDPRDGSTYFAMAIDSGSVSFDTSSNRLYTLEYSTNLVAAPWTPLVEDEPGTGSAVTIPHTNDYDACFYRTQVALP